MSQGVGSKHTWDVEPGIRLSRSVKVFAFELGEDFKELGQEAGELGSELVVVTKEFGV